MLSRRQERGIQHRLYAAVHDHKDDNGASPGLAHLVHEGGRNPPVPHGITRGEARNDLHVVAREGEEPDDGLARGKRLYEHAMVRMV